MIIIDADWPPSSGEGCPDHNQSPNAVPPLAITCTHHPRMTLTGPIDGHRNSEPLGLTLLYGRYRLHTVS